MGKVKTRFQCEACGAVAPTWVGRCPSCDEWNTLAEVRGEAAPEVSARTGLEIGVADVAQPIVDVAPMGGIANPTGVTELDRVLSGGLVPGSVTLVGGEPGVGKSTLLLQTLAAVARQGVRALYVTGEESKEQVRVRAERLGALEDTLWLVSATALPHILAQLEEQRPDLVVIDSIQTVFDPDFSSAPGSVSQVRECAHRLVTAAKSSGAAMVLVGHVTKDGGLAGPRVLEHLVDTVLAFEGDRHHALRLLRVLKHRFGTTNELGLFEMSDAGLIGVPDASGMFLADRRLDAPGSAVVPVMEGRRPLLVEVQALVAPLTVPNPRRSAHGLDQGRLGLLLAVLTRYCGHGVRFSDQDVYALAVGGVRISEPAADLALAMAAVSSKVGAPVVSSLVCIGEVGLSGELRSVGQIERRLQEAHRLGFTHAVVPQSAPDVADGPRLIRAATVEAAVQKVGLIPLSAPRAA